MSSLMATETRERMWTNRRLMMESLHHDVVERILERLPVKSLMRLKAVSMQWRSTIESSFFQERHLKQRQQSGDPDVLMVSISNQVESLRTLVLGSSSSVKITTLRGKRRYLVCESSCDGLVCLYDGQTKSSGFVLNPTTRWYRPFPLSGLQLLMNRFGEDYHTFGHESTKLGFGKDKSTGTYKPVWLYNSAEICLKNATTCEVFDFSTNSWRYVTPSSPYRILGFRRPVHVDGSLHWFTNRKENKVVSFDLHTEAFQVVEAPFSNAWVNEIVMCNLDNRLCVSHMKDSYQVIWSFNPGNKTWDKICSIDLDLYSLRFDIPKPLCALQPLALLLSGQKEKKRKLLFHHLASQQALITYDLETKSYDTVFSPAARYNEFPLCYFPSLFSVL